MCIRYARSRLCQWYHNCTVITTNSIERITTEIQWRACAIIFCVFWYSELIRPPVPIAYSSPANARHTDVIAALRRRNCVQKTVRISPHCAGFRSVQSILFVLKLCMPQLMLCNMHGVWNSLVLHCFVNNNTFPVMLNFRLNSRSDDLTEMTRWKTKKEKKQRKKKQKPTRNKFDVVKDFFKSFISNLSQWSTSKKKPNLPFCNAPIW